MSEEKENHTPNEMETENENPSVSEASETPVSGEETTEAEPSSTQETEDTPSPEAEASVLTQSLYQWDYATQLKNDRETLKKQRKTGIKTFAIVMSVTFVITLAVLFLVLWFGQPARKALSTEEIAAKALPQTVLIVAQKSSSVSYGTGFFITQDGYIATNCHVIDGATQITVTLYSGETKNATLKGYSKGDDLAVLKISGQGYSAVTVGNSDAVAIGSTAIAVGNPSGPSYAWSVTQGIISANRRIIFHSDDVMAYETEMMQMDTPVNSGNSGGPLFNEYGEVIGIATRKSTEYEDIGFAIPINGAMKIFDEIIKNGTASGIVSDLTKARPIMGFTGATVKKGEVYNQSGATASSDGVMVLVVDSGGVVYQKIKVGDIIVSLNNQIVTSMEDLTEILYQCKPGQTVSFTVNRNGTLIDGSIRFKSY